MIYIIIYNAETDFIKVYTKEQAESQIADLIMSGYGKDDMELYEAHDKDYKVGGEPTVSIGGSQ